jgi:hypothetical protein
MASMFIPFSSRLITEMGPVGVPKFGPGIPAPNPLSVLDAPLVENPYAWTKKSAMLFVEQPVNGARVRSEILRCNHLTKAILDLLSFIFYN